jgi:hypothetical protein
MAEKRHGMKQVFCAVVFHCCFPMARGVKVYLQKTRVLEFEFTEKLREQQRKNSSANEVDGSFSSHMIRSEMRSA